MLDLLRPAADPRPMARRLGVRPEVRIRRAGIVLGGALMAVVALIGATQPSSAAGVSRPAATAGAVSSTAASVGSAWGAGGSGLDPLDVITKGAVVLFLLFITLRVLGRMQNGAPKRDGRLVVLESRSLAPKASLHLVAVGHRRLVVGLTPSGMVSLAELDASEIKDTEAEAALDAAAASTAGAGAATGAGSAPSFAASALAAFLVPIDAVAGKLATFLGGGRVR